MIRRADLLGRLQAMERAQDLYSVLVDGAPIWPILRVQAGTTALRGSLMGFEAPPPLRTIQRSVATVNALLQWNALRRIPSPEPLLFRTRRVYQAVTPLGTVDKFAHPLMVAAASTGWSSVLLHDGPMPHPPFPQQERIHVRRIDAWLRARSFVFSKRRSVPLAMLDPRVPALIHELVAIVGADGVEDLERAIHHFRLHLWNARTMLERIGPRHVFVTCWYASENMAMAHACHERGIPCTDMQHGVQGPAHLAYGAWHHLPAAGCSSIPSSFWCWDEASAQHIRSWAPEHAHLAYVGGSPWLEENAGATPATPGTILFTMQPLMETIPPGLGHAIRNDGTDLTWVFRLHPNGMHMAGHVQIWAAQERIEHRIRIEQPGERPLSGSLENAVVHVTLFSSVVREAAMLGIPSIAMHPDAETLYPDLVNGPMLSLVLDPGALAQRISMIRSGARTKHRSIPLTERLDDLFAMVSSDRSRRSH